MAPSAAEYWLATDESQRVPVAFSAVVKDANGKALPYPVTWSTADPSVATVDASGLVTGLTAAPVVIEASSGGVTGNAGLCVVGSPTADILPASGSYPAQPLLISAAGSVGSCGRPLRYLWSCARLQGPNPNLCSTVVLPQNATNTMEFVFPLSDGAAYTIALQVCDLADAPPPDNLVACSVVTTALTGFSSGL